MAQFSMPPLGESVTEGTITRWLKKEGDVVEVDEPLVEVSTDKVDSEIPSTVAGTLTRIVAAEGETVEVGAPIAEIDSEAKAPVATQESQNAASPAGAAGESLPVTAEPEDVPSRAASSADKADPKAVQEAPAAKADAPRRTILSPLVRRLAAENKVDLNLISGTGTGGRITRQDVLAAVGSAPTNGASGVQAKEGRAPSAAPLLQGDEVVKLTSMRKSIAKNMVDSLRETARAWNTIEVDMTPIAKLRRLAGPAFKQSEGFSLTWTPFVARAVALALAEFPQVNATWNDDGTIVRKHYVNLGIAVALDNGLIVPVIKAAGEMNVIGLAKAIRDLAERARNKRLRPDEVHDGTFTITNPGPFGTTISVPIINKGQAAILAFDAVAKRPVVITDDNGEDSLAIRQMVFLSLSWDHRIIDGAEAAKFLARLKSILQQAQFEADLSAYLPA